MKRTALLLSVVAVLASAPAHATVFGVKSLAASSDGSEAPARLFSFEEDGSSFSDLGTITIGGGAVDADALAISQNHGLLAFQVGINGEGDGSRLISLGGGAAAASVVGGILTGRDIRGAAFDLNDRLWVVDAASDELLQIDPSTGGLIGGPMGLTIGGSAANLGFNSIDIAVRGDGSMMVVNNKTGYDLDVLTGALTQVFDHSTALYPELFSGGGKSYAGATFSQSGPAGGLFLYEINGQDDIYRVDAPSFLTHTTVYPNILSSFNAGRGDLASLMPVNAVPVPGALALIGIGLLGLGWRRAKVR